MQRFTPGSAWGREAKELTARLTAFVPAFHHDSPGAMTRIRTTIVLVEDNEAHAARFRDNLAADPALQLLGCYATAQAAIDGIPQLQPDVALVDLGLPDRSGFDVIRAIRASSAHTAVMVVSVFGGERNLIAAIESGATGYLLKDTEVDAFNAGIHALCAGESPISPSLARHLLRRLVPAAAPAAAPAVPSPLTSRETMVLEAIARGNSTAEIGRGMGISPLTVKSHVQNIYRKLEVSSRQRAVFEAQQRGLIA